MTTNTPFYPPPDPQIYHSWYMLFFQLPLLPELWLSAASHGGLRRLWRNWSPGYSPPAAVWDSLIATFQEPGACPFHFTPVMS